MKNNLIICLIIVIFNYSAFSQNISNDEKQNILKSRGYASLGNDNNGLIRIMKIVPRVLTVKDIESSKKYWGTNAENDTRYLTKDIGTKVNSRKFGYISASTLIEVIPAIYDKFDDEFVNGMLLAKRDEKYMLLKKEGDSIETKELINYNYIDFNKCGSFENCYIEREGYRKVKSTNGKWGFVDNNWNIVIPCIYESANGFENGHSAVVQSGIQGIVDKAGNFKPVDNGISIGEFGNEGIAEFTFKNRKGVIDTNGKILIPAKYDSILFTYGQSKISAKIGNKWIDLDRNGTIIFPEKKEIIKTEVVENKSSDGKSTGVNETQNSCNFKFVIPKITWKLVDNRRKCSYCRARYVPYSKKDIAEAKQINTVQSFQSKLSKHWEVVNASDEHKENDREKLTNLFRKNNYSEIAIMNAKLHEMQGPLINNYIKVKREFFLDNSFNDLLDFSRVNLYDVEDSKYCSRKCEREDY